MPNPIKNSTDGELAWNLHNEIVKNEQKRRALLLLNMKHLTELYDSKLYKAVLGDEDAPWSAFLGQFEVFYSRSQVYNYAQIYKKYVKELGLDPEILVDIPHSKLSRLIKIVTKENVEEWLHKARELTSQDFEDEMRVVGGGESYTNCTHSETQKYEVCQKCGFRHKV